MLERQNFCSYFLFYKSIVREKLSCQIWKGIPYFPQTKCTHGSANENIGFNIFDVVLFLQADTSDHEELDPDCSSVQDKLVKYKSDTTVVHKIIRNLTMIAVVFKISWLNTRYRPRIKIKMKTRWRFILKQGRNQRVDW